MSSKSVSQRLLDLEKRVIAIEKQIDNIAGNHSKSEAVADGVISKKRQSSKEFLLTKKFSGDVQKTLLLAYYLEYVDGLESFNVPDLQNTFRAAKEKVPKNLNDMINKNIAKGYLMDTPEKKDSKKAWVVTSSGEQFVEEELNKT